MKKRIIAIILMVALAVMLHNTTAASFVKATIILDGNTLGTYALIDGQTVILPVRDICQALGYEVRWTEKNGVRKITATKNSETVIFDLTHQTVTYNGHLLSAGTHNGSGIRLISSQTYIDSGLFSTIFSVAADYSEENNQVTLIKRVENNLNVKTEKLTSETEYLTAALQYPQLEGLADEAVQTDVNTVFRQLAETAMATGKKNATEMASYIRDGYTGAVGKCETVFDYLVTYNQDGLISIVFIDYQYCGGAHGATTQTAYTIDLTTGLVLSLADVLNNKTDYVPYINASIRHEIDRRVATEQLYEFEFDPFVGISSTTGYYLSNDAVVVYFQEYEHFPYACGIQEFAVSFDELSGMFATRFAFLSGTVYLLKADTNTTVPVSSLTRIELQDKSESGNCWHCIITDGGVVTIVSELYVTDSHENTRTYICNLKTVGTGEAVITFKYFSDLEDEVSAEDKDTRVFYVTVS